MSHVGSGLYGVLDKPARMCFLKYFFKKETLWYSGVHVYLPGHTMTDFLLSHNLHNSYNFHYFCHIVSSVCQY